MVQPRTSPSLSVWVIPMAVMTAAIGLPLAVHKFSGNPATVAAIGMLSGFWSGWLTLGVSHDGESRTGL